MTDFRDQDLTRSSFEQVDLRDATFRHATLAGARFEGVDLSGVVMAGVDLIDVEVYADVRNLVINGVDVAPLIEAELDRRQPLRVKMRPTDPAGFREAWDVVEELWDGPDGTVARARRLDPGLLHASVDGEWSFIETLRHLVFATESWVCRGILGDPSPWHPLSLPWDQMPDTEGVPRDRAVRPTLDEALVLRHDRMSVVRRVVDGLSDAQLDAETEPVEGPGWPPAGATFPVRECLLTVLNEEWEHRRFAERDLAVLEEGAGGGGV